MLGTWFNSHWFPFGLHLDQSGRYFLFFPRLVRLLLLYFFMGADVFPDTRLRIHTLAVSIVSAPLLD